MTVRQKLTVEKNGRCHTNVYLCEKLYFDVFDGFPAMLLQISRKVSKKYDIVNDQLNNL